MKFGQLTSFLLLASVSIGSLAVAAPAFAQADERAAAETTDDIIVTARRRQESILKVPVVENVLSSVQIERAQITDLSTLSTRVPGLNIGNAALSIGPQISLRGIGTNSLDAGIDQSVSLNIDGLSLTQGLAYTAGVFDLQQVEVLKGPQALFFGKNSPAGVIALRTADPGDSLEIKAVLGYEAEAHEKRGEFVLSGPVSDTFGLRLATLASFQDGFFYNRAQNLTADAIARGAALPGRRVADSRNFIIRGTALWKPTDQFTMRIKANFAYDNVDGDAAQGQRAYCPDGVRPTANGLLFTNPDDNCQLDRTTYFVYMNPANYPGIRNAGRPFIVRDQKFGTVEMNYTTDSKISLTSITGYYRVDSDSAINATQTGFYAPPYAADNHLYRHDFTQEFRADTDFSSPLNLTGGAFYQKSTLFLRLQLPVNRSLLPLPSFPSGFLAKGSNEVDIEAWSAFAQLRYKITPTLELTGGARYADETRSDLVLNLQGATPVDISLPNRGKISSKTWSPEATLTWTPTDEFTVFAAARQGYKSGSFTITTPTPTPPFGDERVRGGEVGIKTRLADRQIFLNAAAYYYKYQGLQVGVSLPDPVTGAPIVRTVNAAGARVYGVDFDLTYRPASIEGLSITAAANWNKANFTSFADAQCIPGQTIAQGCNRIPNTTGAAGSTDTSPGSNFGKPLFTAQDLSGLSLPRAPEWQLTGTVDYELPVGANRVLRLGLAGLYSSSYVRTLGREPEYFQAGYATIDANIAFGTKGDGWELALLGRNLTNKITAGSCTATNFENAVFYPGQITGGATAGTAGKSELSCIPRRGRELWARITIKG